MLTTDLTGSRYTNKNIRIIGGVLNGNGNNQPATTNRAETGHPYAPKSGIWINWTDGIIIEDLTIRNAQVYGSRFNDDTNGYIRNIRFLWDDGGVTDNNLNRDSLHLDGPINNFHIDGLRSNGDDDVIGFNTCDLTNQCFAASFRDRSEPRHAVSQDNDLPFRLHLLRSLGFPRWPYSYDPWSGDPGITTIISLRDEATAAVLCSTSPLNPVRHGFEGILHTNTFEVAPSWLPGSSSKPLLSVDLIDGSGNKINPFRRSIVLRANPSTVPAARGAIYYFPEVTTYLGSDAAALQAKPTRATPAPSSKPSSTASSPAGASSPAPPIPISTSASSSPATSTSPLTP
jgi:hypothetical protein